MNSLGRRQKEREETRSRILDAARELFVAHGYDAVTMRKVAAKIDYKASAIYKHFADKEALIRELCDQDFLALGEQFARIAREADPIERIRTVGMSYVRFALAYPNHYRLMFMTSKPDFDPSESEVRHGDPDQDAYAFVKAAVTEALAAGRFREEYADADLLAQVFWAGVHGVVSLRITKGHDAWITWAPVEDAARAMIDATLRGVLREDEAR